MKYNLTDKLKFDEDPIIVIRDQEIKICSDAEVVLQLLDIMENESEVAGMMKAKELLFSKEDQKKIKSLRLKAADYNTFLRAAIDLAIGADPDEEEGE